LINSGEPGNNVSKKVPGHTRMVAKASGTLGAVRLGMTWGTLVLPTEVSNHRRAETIYMYTHY
jgi:hypothetical protein